MPKEIVLYNLAPHVTEEEYQAYADKELGPLLDSFQSVTKYQLVKVTGSLSGEIPYRYIAIIDVTSLDELHDRDQSSEAFQEFAAKWQPMASEFHTLFGEEIH